MFSKVPQAWTYSNLYCVSDSGTTGILLCSAWQNTWRTGMWPLNSVRLQYASAQLMPAQLTKVTIFAEQTQRRLVGNWQYSIHLSSSSQRKWARLMVTLQPCSQALSSCFCCLFICFYCLFVFVFCFVYCSEKTWECRPPSQHMLSFKFENLWHSLNSLVNKVKFFRLIPQKIARLGIIT